MDEVQCKRERHIETQDKVNFMLLHSKCNGIRAVYFPKRLKIISRYLI